MPETRVCSVDDVPRGAARRFDVDGHHLALVRLSDDSWYVLGDTCSHADFSLSLGDVWEDDRTVECPQHGATFSLDTGEPCSLPATRPVPTYPVRVDGDDVMVEVQ